LLTKPMPSRADDLSEERVKAKVRGLQDHHPAA
jgi:hypothetical protein